MNYVYVSLRSLSLPYVQIPYFIHHFPIPYATLNITSTYFTHNNIINVWADGLHTILVHLALFRPSVVSLCATVHACMYVHVYVCMYCMYICMYMCMYVCIVCIYVCACMYVCMYVCPRDLSS